MIVKLQRNKKEEENEKKKEILWKNFYLIFPKALEKEEKFYVKEVLFKNHFSINSNSFSFTIFCAPHCY